MARAKAVEEVHEGDGSLDGSQVGHGCEVCCLLHAARGELGKARITAGHDIRVVAEDAQRVGAYSAAGNVEHAREPLAGDPVEHRHHEHEALARGEARAQGACLQ